jgi:Cytochrome P460
MKRQHVFALVLVIAPIVVVSIATAAQDRFTLKSANGIAFAEFKGYDAWQVIAPSVPDNAGGCGSAKDGCIKAIVGNSTMIKAYAAGGPSSAQPVPDGAAMAKIEWSSKHVPGPPYAVTAPGTLAAISFMLKDAKRFPDTDGWGYVTFNYNAATDTFKPSTDNPAVMRTSCHACHIRGAKAHDFVYTNFAKR